MDTEPPVREYKTIERYICEGPGGCGMEVADKAVHDRWHEYTATLNSEGDESKEVNPHRFFGDESMTRRYPITDIRSDGEWPQ